MEIVWLLVLCHWTQEKILKISSLLQYSEVVSNDEVDHRLQKSSNFYNIDLDIIFKYNDFQMSCIF